jgi:uncharacterized membrane protein
MESEKTPNSNSSKLLTYVRSVNSTWYFLTLIINSITLITVFIIPENFYPYTYARAVMVALSILWLPGYSLIRALFPIFTPIDSAKNLESVARGALNIGMSICIITIMGLLLNYTPWGIHLIPMILSLFGITTFFATVALLREYKTNKELNASN